MPIRNAKRPTMISEGEIVGLTDKEKKVLEDAGIAGGNEIPTITLMPASADPISGTLSDEDYTTIQNNNIIKFIVPNTVDAIVSKQVSQGMFLFFFLLGGTIYNLLIQSDKSFSISQTQLPLGMKIYGNNLGVYDTTSNLMGGTVSKTQMQEWLETADYAKTTEANTFTETQTFDGTLGINIGSVHLTEAGLTELENQAEKIPTLEKTVASKADKSYVDTEIENIELTPGPQGPQGPQGEQGPQGPAGTQGPAGEPGYPTLPEDASTKTYVLKAVNGVLTWVEETA